MWQMQWPYPSPYVTATPAARIETSHRSLRSELSVALAHVNVVCVVTLLRSVLAYFTSRPQPLQRCSTRIVAGLSGMDS
jgi:hypothetical protein